MGKKMKMTMVALAGLLGVLAIAPAAHADEDDYGRGRAYYGERYEQRRDFDHDWRRDRFERRHFGWNRGGWRDRFEGRRFYR